MYTELDLFLLDAAKGYIRSLSDEQFLALTCDLTNLHDELIRTVHRQSLHRKFRAPFKVTADVFLCKNLKNTPKLRPNSSLLFAHVKKSLYFCMQIYLYYVFSE